MPKRAAITIRYMDGKILIDELVSKRCPLEEINEAFDDMEAGAVARSVLEPARSA